VEEQHHSHGMPLIVDLNHDQSAADISSSWEQQQPVLGVDTENDAAPADECNDQQRSPLSDHRDELTSHIVDNAASPHQLRILQHGQQTAAPVVAASSPLDDQQLPAPGPPPPRPPSIAHGPSRLALRRAAPPPRPASVSISIIIISIRQH